ncbi:MAG: Protein lysine acetyltransferase Pat [Prosthecobacter sp.]|nr:Protein lysine acetyltransferase Pat [Prosthecobacter sp.]
MPDTALASCSLTPGASELHALFAPRSVALVGATDREGSVGRALLENLCGFGGELYPVNARRSEVLGRRAWTSLTAVGRPVDLAVIATPAATLPEVIRECAACGVKGVVIISAGFKETGPGGVELERRVLAEARKAGVRLVGPNCLGLMSPHAGLNATFATAMARPGRVAFLSQSGALCTAILDWSFRQQVGFSAFVSVGSMLDVGWGDLLHHFGEDPDTGSIVLYMESVGDAAAFMEAARIVAAKKPVIAIKVGRTAAAARAAASHTGAMTGSDDVLDAAFERAGVLRVDTIEELFDMAEVLAKQSLPQGPALAVVTNAGGPGALATDALVRAGGVMAGLSVPTLERLDQCLPAHWSHGNPVDVLGDADAGRFTEALRAVAADPGVHGLLTVLTPQAMTHPLPVAQALIDVAQTTDKPVLASWMGGDAVEEARTLLNKAGLPTYDYPDEAARAWQFMWQRQERLRLLAETNRVACLERPTMSVAREIITGHRAAGRGLLNEAEAKQVLAAAGIPVLETVSARTPDEAVQAAERLGFPVVLKLQSRVIIHKTDVGGVQLDLKDEGSVRAAWSRVENAVPADAFDGVGVQRMVKDGGLELICGCVQDAQFGPVLMFGAGGVMVEVLQDRVLLLPPLSPMLAMDRVRRTRIHHALQGTRHLAAVDMDALTDVLVRLGDLVLAVPEILELDINPLVATAAGVLALDARIVIRA